MLNKKMKGLSKLKNNGEGKMKEYKSSKGQGCRKWGWILKKNSKFNRKTLPL